MNILKHGDPELLNKKKCIKYFTCDYCHCEFTANEDEYESAHTTLMGCDISIHSTTCPEWRGGSWIMEIIKHGDPDRIKQVKYFVCNKCGCEFKADNTEYEEQLVEYISAVEYVMACPECGARIVGTDPPKTKQSKPKTKSYDFCQEHDCDIYAQDICVGCDEYYAWSKSGKPNDWTKWRSKNKE